MLTQERVKELFEYKDGNLYWKKMRQGVKPDRKAGCNDREYMRIGIDRKMYLLHQVIYLYHFGYIPEEIDHKDRNGFNNRIENLRECDRFQNSYNQRMPKNNTSGVKGVSFDKNNKKWRAILIVKGKKMDFGSYHDIDYAKFIIDAMRYKYHGNYAKG